MVTHNWSNLFHHLVAAIFADALEKEYYEGVPLSKLKWNVNGKTGQRLDSASLSLKCLGANVLHVAVWLR